MLGSIPLCVNCLQKLEMPCNNCLILDASNHKKISTKGKKPSKYCAICDGKHINLCTLCYLLRNKKYNSK